MKIKSILKNFALAGLIVIIAAGAASANVNENAICQLMESLQSVFKILRTLAFIGAAFMIAGWAWGYISAGAIGKEGKWADEVKQKGIALIVGFILLFGVGMILTFLTSATGAKALDCVTKGW